ncbi:MAG: dicarboxylate/amino acid:cation symporter [Pseudomonadota bacterium]|jgi:Na+/H+-dicarboxylate symporter|nr:dicarboxylate/amino acid:cation symporter [Alphaproteobacteria bacterium]
MHVIRSFKFLLLMVFLGIAVGISQQPQLLEMARILSDVFMRLLKLVSLPIISFSLLSTLSGIGKWSEIKNLGHNVIRYTLITTVLSAITAWVLYVLVEPEATIHAATVVHEGIADANTTYLGALLNIFPSNLLQPFLEHNVMGVMFITIVLSFAVMQLPTEKREFLHTFFDNLFSTVMIIIKWITGLMPFAVWAFLVEFTQEVQKGLKIGELASYLAIVVAANLIQASITLPLMLKKNGINPLQAFKTMLPALSLAFFSKSSAAAMPLAMQCSHRCGVKTKVSQFSFPLCTSINMNACAAFILITVLFVAENYGMHFTFVERILWIIMASVAAIGNAGVPMGCFFLSCALLTAMGVPITMMGVILPFYALLDMLESAINIWSDACVTLIVNKKAE